MVCQGSEIRWQIGLAARHVEVGITRYTNEKKAWAVAVVDGFPTRPAGKSAGGVGEQGMPKQALNRLSQIIWLNGEKWNYRYNALDRRFGNSATLFY